MWLALRRARLIKQLTPAVRDGVDEFMLAETEALRLDEQLLEVLGQQIPAFRGGGAAQASGTVRSAGVGLPGIRPRATSWIARVAMRTAVTLTTGVRRRSSRRRNGVTSSCATRRRSVAGSRVVAVRSRAIGNTLAAARAANVSSAPGRYRSNSVSPKRNRCRRGAAEVPSLPRPR